MTRVFGKLDGLLVPQFENPQTATAAVVYENTSALDARSDEPCPWLVTVQLQPMLISDLTAQMIATFARGPLVSVTAGNPESPPLSTGMRVQWGYENVQHFVDVDVSRGVTIPVYGSKVQVRGLGRYGAGASQPWPNAWRVTAAPGASARNYRPLRRSVLVGGLAAGIASALFPIPVMATRGELSTAEGFVSPPSGNIVEVAQCDVFGVVQSVWQLPADSTSYMTPDLSFPVDPRASYIRVTNRSPLIVIPSIVVAFDLAL
jgi:hypothetical protein